MEIITYRNLKILRNPSHVEAVLYAHGSYTPKRPFRPGSRIVTCPNNMSVCFYTAAKEFGIGSKRRIREAIEATNGPPVEVINPGAQVINYNLSHAKRDGAQYRDEQWLDANSKRDLILVRTTGNATLADVFDLVVFFRLPYTRLHNYHCRVNSYTANLFDQDQ